jgi:hypothetical protein
MIDYLIEVTLIPDDGPEAQVDTPYFWCILAYNTKSKNPVWYNTGFCGWKETPLTAFIVAMEYYNKNIRFAQNYRE